MAMTLDEFRQRLSRIKVVDVRVSLTVKTGKASFTDAVPSLKPTLVLELDGRRKSYFLPDFKPGRGHPKSVERTTMIVHGALLNLLGGRFVAGIKPGMWNERNSALYWKARSIRDSISRKMSRAAQKGLVKKHVANVERKKEREKAMSEVKAVLTKFRNVLRRHDINNAWNEVSDLGKVEDVMRS